MGFGSGFKVGSCVWQALRDFKDTKHIAWNHVRDEDAEKMWKDLEEMGVVFVEGILPSYESKKQAAKQAEKSHKDATKPAMAHTQAVGIFYQVSDTAMMAIK